MYELKVKNDGTIDTNISNAEFGKAATFFSGEAKKVMSIHQKERYERLAKTARDLRNHLNLAQIIEDTGVSKFVACYNIRLVRDYIKGVYLS